jgi:hypothetical protein
LRLNRALWVAASAATFSRSKKWILTPEVSSKLESIAIFRLALEKKSPSKILENWED